MDVPLGILHDGSVTTPLVDSGHVLAPSIRIDIRFVDRTSSVTPPVVVLMPASFVELPPDMIFSDVTGCNRWNECCSLCSDRYLLQFSTPAVMLMSNHRGLGGSVPYRLIRDCFSYPITDCFD